MEFIKKSPEEKTVTKSPQILETPRLILREFSTDDVDALGNVLSDPETMRFYPAPLDRAGVEEWIARNCRRYANDGHGLWAMILKADGELIGDCGLTVQPVDGTDEIEIGYHVCRDGGKAWRRKRHTPAATMDSPVFPSIILFLSFVPRTCPRAA
jgi:ribosomal-protein-alanine N-acetyltransferase